VILFLWEFSFREKNFLSSTVFSLPIAALSCLYFFLIVKPSFSDLSLITKKQKFYNLRDVDLLPFPPTPWLGSLILFSIFFWSISLLKSPAVFISKQIHELLPTALYIRIDDSPFKEVSNEWFLLEKENTFPIQLNSKINLKLKRLKKEKDWFYQISFKNQQLEWMKLSNYLSERTIKGILMEAGYQKDLYKNTKDEFILIDLKENHEAKKKITLEFHLPTQPQVNLSPLPNQKPGELLFALSVYSEVPLSHLNVLLQTKSGYETLRKFKSFSQEKAYEDPAWSLSYFGIPFQKEDELKVKVIAQTSEESIYGESREWIFPIKSPNSLIEEIVRALLAISQHLDHVSQPFDQWKTKLKGLFSESLEAAEKMQDLKTLQEELLSLKQDSNALTPQSDDLRSDLKKRIDALLKLFLSQKKEIDLILFLTQLLNLKNQLAGEEWPPSRFKEKIEPTNDLVESHQVIDEQAQALIKKYSAHPDEDIQKLAKNAQKDKTATHLKQLKENLTNQNQDQGFLSADGAFESFTSFILPLFQIEQEEQKRQQEEQQQLQNEISENLEQLMDQIENEDQEGASETLKKMEKLLENSSIEDKKQWLEIIKNLQNQIQNKQFSEAKESLEKLVDKLKEFQLEKELIQDIQKEINEHYERLSHQHQNELLESKDLKDLRWRERLLEDISLEKNRGRSSHSPQIQYLEEQLK
jgi:hypothetical protein